MSKSKIRRETKETKVEVSIGLDGSGKAIIKTPFGFLNHMLEQLAKNSLIDIVLVAEGDMKVDEHHIVEDAGIVLGAALRKSLGEKKGIRRYGSAILPMDESLAMVSMDLAGRYSFNFDAEFSRERVGGMPTELVYDFFDALTQSARMTLHIRLLAGRNEHHKIEAIFKAFGRALREACRIDTELRGRIPSTKGML